MSVKDDPNMYDLPVAPAFLVFTAPIQDPSRQQEKQAVFRLKKNVYNPMTSNQISTSIMCKYTPGGCYKHVPEATKNNNIFSVGGELVIVKKSIFILAEAIEWN